MTIAVLTVEGQPTFESAAPELRPEFIDQVVGYLHGLRADGSKHEWQEAKAIDRTPDPVDVCEPGPERVTDGDPSAAGAGPDTLDAGFTDEPIHTG